MSASPDQELLHRGRLLGRLLQLVPEGLAVAAELEQLEASGLAWYLSTGPISWSQVRAGLETAGQPLELWPPDPVEEVEPRC